MAKFKIGDKVKVTWLDGFDETVGILVGDTGVIEKYNENLPFVSFRKRGRYMEESQLELVEEMKTVIVSGVKKQCLDIAELLERKDKDYDSAFSKSYKEFGMTSVAIRLNDKVERLKNLVKGKEPNFESIDDTLMDIAGYAILALVERQGD
jgi:hypothetical protein